MVTETADGTLVAITREASGELLRSTRAPGADWVAGDVFAEPGGLAMGYVEAVQVTPDGAGWLAYHTRDDADPDDFEGVRVVRWDPSGSSEQLGTINDAWTTVAMRADGDGDVLLTYGQRGGYPLTALYGNVDDGLAFLDVPTWTGGQRPHQWVLGPDDDVLLVSREGRRLRAVELSPGEPAATTDLGRVGGSLTDQVAAAISPSGVQYAAWTTARKGAPKVVRVARRSPGGAWRPGRVVDRVGKRARPQHSLAVRATASGAYLAWAQPARAGAKIRGALVRRNRPVARQAVAGSRAVGDLSRPRFVLDVTPRGRLLVGWTRVAGTTRTASAALGRVRGKPTVARLFEVDGVPVPVVLLRRAGEATVVGGTPSSSADVHTMRSVSTD